MPNLYRSFYQLAIPLTLSIPSTAYTAEDELFFDMPIVLSANRLEQPVSDAAVSISVIDRETIEASGARTIPEVLRLVPGMQVGYSGNEFGDEPKYVVAYHGHSDQYSKQMQVLIDGRSIYEPFFGGINWKAVPVNIDDIERIEVSRGPNLATYGSNTFQAAINIITRTAAEDQGAYIHANAGNHDIADLALRYGGSSGKLDYRVTASTLNDDGLDSGNQYEQRDDTSSNNIDYRLDYQVNNNNTLSYQGGYGSNEQEADRNHADVLPTERTVDNTHFFQFIKWENVVDDENTLQLQYYYNLSDKEDRYASDLIATPDPIDDFILDVNADIKTERHNLELTHFLYPNENLKLVWGLSAQRDLVQSALYLGTDEKITQNQYRGFANVEWYLNKRNSINIGGLLEKNDYSDAEVSPRLSFIHAFNQQHKVRLGVSRAIRSPFTYESVGALSYSHELTSGGAPLGLTLLENVIRGNTELANEEITSHEIVYFGEFLNASLLFNARLFYDVVDSYIDTLKETDTNSDPTVILYDDVVHVFHNPIDSTTKGLELEFDYRVDPSLRFIASGAILYISSNSDAIERSVPQNSFSLLATKAFNDKYSGSLGYYFVDQFKWTDARVDTAITDPDLKYTTDDYHTIDIRLSRHIRFSQSHGSVSVVVKNLLDDYSDYQKAPLASTAPVAIHNTTAYLDFRLRF